MKKPQTSRLALRLAITVLAFAFMLTSAHAASAPAVVGDWQGVLDTGSGSLHVVLHVSQGNDGKLTATLDSPDQGATGIAINSITYNKPVVHFEIEKLGASYDGTINEASSEIAGNWKQGTVSLPLNFKRAGK
jgi:hypothetical protein